MDRATKSVVALLDLEVQAGAHQPWSWRKNPCIGLTLLLAQEGLCRVALGILGVAHMSFYPGTDVLLRSDGENHWFDEFAGVLA